jgi:hypothetical protein
MSTSNTSFPIGGAIAGVNLTNTSTTPEFAVGHKVQTKDGIYEYVKAGSGIAAYDCVLITGSGVAVPSLTATAVSIKKPGFAQVAIASGSYGWVAREGDTIRVNCAANCAAGVQLYTTATAGVLDDTIVSQGALHGVVSLGSISNATSNTIVAASPHIGFGSGN